MGGGGCAKYDVRRRRQPVWTRFTCRVHAVGNIELVKNERKRWVYLVHPAVSSVVFRAPGGPSHSRRRVGRWQRRASWSFFRVIVVSCRGDGGRWAIGMGMAKDKSKPPKNERECLFSGIMVVTDGQRRRWWPERMSKPLKNDHGYPFSGVMAGSCWATRAGMTRDGSKHPQTRFSGWLGNSRMAIVQPSEGNRQID